VFALLHLQYHGFSLSFLMQAGWTFLVGILFGAIAARTRMLVPAMLLHIANNVISLLF